MIAVGVGELTDVGLPSLLRTSLIIEAGQKVAIVGRSGGKLLFTRSLRPCTAGMA